jgi:cobalamin synthase
MSSLFEHCGFNNVIIQINSNYSEFSERLLGSRFFLELRLFMLIKIIMAVFIALLVITACFLLLHKEAMLQALGQEITQRKLTIVKDSAYGLLFVSAIGIIIVIACPPLLNVLTLVLACLIILLFSQLIMSK